MFRLLVEEKKGEENTKLSGQDFKTLADVLTIRSLLSLVPRHPLARSLALRRSLWVWQSGRGDDERGRRSGKSCAPNAGELVKPGTKK